MLVVGTAGASVGDREGFRGPALYVSYDDGATFEMLPRPENKKQLDSLWPGHVAERYDYDGKYLYVTFAQTAHRCFNLELSYSCDCGQVQGGRVVRYSFGEDGKITGYEDITPYNTIYGGYFMTLSKEDRWQVGIFLPVAGSSTYSMPYLHSTRPQ